MIEVVHKLKTTDKIDKKMQWFNYKVPLRTINIKLSICNDSSNNTFTTPNNISEANTLKSVIGIILALFNRIFWSNLLLLGRNHVL